jgi:hypothetical protein
MQPSYYPPIRHPRLLSWCFPHILCSYLLHAIQLLTSIIDRHRDRASFLIRYPQISEPSSLGIKHPSFQVLTNRVFLLAKLHFDPPLPGPPHHGELARLGLFRGLPVVVLKRHGNHFANSAVRRA